MKDFQGKTAVVTGAAGGMGRSIALSLAREGANVVISDIDLDNAETVRKEAESYGVKALAHRTDVGDRASMQELADLAFDTFGTVEILVNNAGVTMRPFRAVWDTAYEDFQWVVNVNIWGVINGVNAFVPRMRLQSGEKHLVNVSSMGVQTIVPGHSTYVLTKAAVAGFSEVIREELADFDFGVTIVYPGHVPTRIATSERLRPVEEQSATRGVISYDTYTQHKSEEEIGRDPGVRGGTVNIRDAGQMTKPLDPDLVGPMVIEGIRQNILHLSTHPAPIVALQRRVDLLEKSYVGDPALFA